MRKACALVSGGLDSGLLVADLLAAGYEVHPLYVRAGLRWERAELHWLRRYLRALSSPRLKALTVAEAPARWLLGRHWSLTGRGVPSDRAAWDSVYLPGRNLTLLSTAGLYCARARVDEVFLGVLEGNPFPDARPSFLSSMERALRAGLGRPLRVRAPFRHVRKSKLARSHAGLPLHLTFSCIDPKGLRPCGKCSKCGERRSAYRPVAG